MYRNGEWDYELYRENDIHAIKGANRAHKLLIRIGEDRHAAKEIAVAVLLHADSYLPKGELKLKPLQQVVALPNEADEVTGGNNYYKIIEELVVLEHTRALDLRTNSEMEAANEIV